MLNYHPDKKYILTTVLLILDRQLQLGRLIINTQNVELQKFSIVQNLYAGSVLHSLSYVICNLFGFIST